MAVYTPQTAMGFLAILTQGFHFGGGVERINECALVLLETPDLHRRPLDPNPTHSNRARADSTTPSLLLPRCWLFRNQ